MFEAKSGLTLVSLAETDNNNNNNNNNSSNNNIDNI